jgi:hypothetical protein
MNILDIAIFALAAAGIAGLIRALPFWPQAWKAKKPLGCVFCMGGWCALFVMLAADIGDLWTYPGLIAAVLTWLGATGGAALALSQSGVFAGDLFAHDP